MGPTQLLDDGLHRTLARGPARSIHAPTGSGRLRTTSRTPSARYSSSPPRARRRTWRPRRPPSGLRPERRANRRNRRRNDDARSPPQGGRRVIVRLQHFDVPVLKVPISVDRPDHRVASGNLTMRRDDESTPDDWQRGGRATSELTADDQRRRRQRDRVRHTRAEQQQRMAHPCQHCPGHAGVHPVTALGVQSRHQQCAVDVVDVLRIAAATSSAFTVTTVGALAASSR